MTRGVLMGRAPITVGDSGKKRGRMRCMSFTIPTDIETADPQPQNFFGFETSLQATDLLHCDMYDDALFPVALANKLVSLSAHPSQRIFWTGSPPTQSVRPRANSMANSRQPSARSVRSVTLPR